MTSRKNKGKVKPRSYYQHRSKYDPNKEKEAFKRHNTKGFSK